MKKKLSITVKIIYILLSVFIIYAGLFVTDSLPSTLQVKLNSVLGEIGLPVSNSDVISGLHGQTHNVSSDESFLPENMHGIWLNLNEDLSSSASSGTEVVKAETDVYFNSFKNYLGDTLFVRPDITGEYSALYNDDSTVFDLLKYVTDKAIDEGMFVVLIADESIALNQNGKPYFELIKYYLSSYSFDAVLLSLPSVAGSDVLYDAVKNCSLNIDASFPSKHLGVRIEPDAAFAFAAPVTLSVIDSGYASFFLVDAYMAINASSGGFKTVFNWFNTLAASYADTQFYCLNRTDLVCSNKSDWSSYTEIVEQLRYLWDCDNFSGSCFYNAYSLFNDKTYSSQRISYFLYDGEYDDLTVKRIILDSSNNTVSFYGTAAASHKLYCNGEVASNGGSFVLKYSLTVGTNEFEFSSCGKSITYRVYNNTNLMCSYYPQQDMNVAKDDVLTVYAVCMDNSEVFAVLNGESYKMTKDTGISADEKPEGYSVFSCKISFENNSYTDINLGELSITSMLGNANQTVSCGRVTLLKSNTSGFVNSILEFFYSVFFKDSVKTPVQTEVITSDPGLTPYEDHSLGTSLMCRVYYDNTEQLGIAGEYNTYHPDNSTLAEGTYDYIDHMTVSEEGYIRYELRSGISVYGVNCELINNAYNMPDNRVVVNRVDDSSDAVTNLIFDETWMSPVTVKLLPQSYYTGYLNYSYNISSFTAQYADIKFYYTSQFFNAALLNFSENSAFSSYEVFSGDDTSVTLRLYLRNPGRFYGFDIYRNDSGQLVLSFKKNAYASLAGKTVMLDPGHGGLAMTGTALNDNTVPEADVTLAIAFKVKQLLEAKGAKVLLTRSMDTPMTLSERAELSAEVNPDMFVSIHCDGSDNTSDSGTHTFYYNSYSQPLAQCIQKALVYNYSNYIYTAADGNYSSIDRKIKYYPFYVTRFDECPSVLVETGFMTNPVEGRILTDSNCQYWIADGITNGIEAYFNGSY